MTGTYHILFHEGLEPDEYYKNLRRTFNTAQGVDNTTVDVELVDVSAQHFRSARLTMTKTVEIGDNGDGDSFSVQGYGVVVTPHEDIHPLRDARPIRCVFNMRTNHVNIEMIKRGAKH